MLPVTISNTKPKPIYNLFKATVENHCGFAFLGNQVRVIIRGGRMLCMLMTIINII
jgi:hypothetical protein